MNVVCHSSLSHWCVCATCGVEVAMVAMPPFIPHTHVEECEEWHQRPRSHTCVAVCGQMDSMALVLVLVLPIQCDGTSLVTITTHVPSLTRDMEKNTTQRECEKDMGDEIESVMLFHVVRKGEREEKQEE